MQHAPTRARPHEIQVPPLQRTTALARQSGGPSDTRTRLLDNAPPANAACAFEPSETAIGIGGGAFTMAQRFFAESGTPPLTGTIPDGSGGR
jgi:hypothetical protein